MKYCEKCGAKLKDDVNFCSKCGTKVDSNDNNTSDNKNKISPMNIAFIIFLIVLVLGIIAAIVYFFVFKDKSNATDNPQVNVTTNTTNNTAPAAPTQNANEYIIPDSDKRVIAKEELSKLSPELVRLACNELYARHGRKFQDSSIQEHFNKCSWYRGTIEPDAFDENLLNDFERQNKDIILAYEKENGINQVNTAVAPNDVPDSGYRGDQLAFAHDYPNFTGYTNDQLVRAARLDINSLGTYPQTVEIENVQGDKVTIHMYSETDTRMITYDRYIVNRRGNGYNTAGQDIELWYMMDRIY